MPPGGATPSLDSPLTIIFHNIPYANLGCGRKPGRFGYPLAAVKEMPRMGRGIAGGPPVPSHG